KPKNDKITPVKTSRNDNTKSNEKQQFESSKSNENTKNDNIEEKKF
ncbi:21699_t:CDS:1, partial [Dentiscutata erythropus]